MHPTLAPSLFEDLRHRLDGELLTDTLSTAIYATDASVYRSLPLAVAYPKTVGDIKRLMAFAKEHGTSLIPRTAGTSLAGQCVGTGIVVDVSKYFTKILDINEKERTVTVQPGVVRDQLNNYLKPFGLFFGPNTSTSNRCMIGGMVGNNSSGTTSIKYGVTRDKVLKLTTVLSDGSEAVFHELNKQEFEAKTSIDSLEGHIYRAVKEQLQPAEVRKEIAEKFPKPEIHRRNTGYAIDELIKSNIFDDSFDEGLNMCKLLCGSEGTLAFTTEITLQLDVLPPEHSVMVAAHFHSIEQCLNSVQMVMQHNLYTCEMMDKTILDCTKHNKAQSENRRFVIDDPMAILMCEVRATTPDAAQTMAQALVRDIERSDHSYAFPILMGDGIDKAMELRKAGLGLLGNIIGDEKSAACIEDTAVALPDLANYIEEFSQLMKRHGQKAIYYAHAGAGELHLRPILNLKTGKGVSDFRRITMEVAHLVKKYNGSLSGEHGDGIVRAEFIEMMVGENNYTIFKKIKWAFDPDNILNPGKIVEPYPMDKNLRYQPDRAEPEIKTLLDFSSSMGILREAEKCNGSGDCRKLPEFGGTMCPSYRATRNEKDTTRARANALREFLTNSIKKNKFDHQELKEVFDLCLSCKACASECPSSVDVASLKAEFQYQYQKANGVGLRNRLMANINAINALGSKFPRLTNWVFVNKQLSRVIKSAAGMAEQRHLPLLSKISMDKHFKNGTSTYNAQIPIKKTIYFFKDEFTNYLDVKIGYDAIMLLIGLGYKVEFAKHWQSGRALISKGLLDKAKTMADQNIDVFKNLISEDTPLVGLEPSAILTFRDEYIKLAQDKVSAQAIALHTFLIEEFIQQEIQLGNITADQFTDEAKTIKFHGHCHQKALGHQSASFEMLNLPKNYRVSIIASGCCGMAGSFGYEKEHYDVSMAIGEQTLFPAVRNADIEVLIAANGTSCRHQIHDGTGREALHPVTILRQALK